VSGPPDPAFDLAIIGGGINGTGIARDAAGRGWSVYLCEQGDLGGATSSASTKLIHGGLRYLEHGDLRLVRESLAERAILLRIAPSLVRLVPFHIPIYRATRRRPWQIRAGLALYAALGGFSSDARFRSLPRAEWETLDGLALDGLEAVFGYLDGQTDDAALARAVLRSAQSLGAETALPARFAAAVRDGDGYRVRYERDGGEIECRASAIVNAAGPWIESVRALVSPAPPGFAVDLVAGTHVELDGAIERGIYYAEAPADARAVFVMPWHGHTLVGTTETLYAGDPRAVRPTYARYFPRGNARRIDAWAGLRVLPRARGAAFARPRETTLVCDDERAPRMIAIYGGKLTGYRATADKVAARLARTLPRAPRRADTRTLALEPAS